MIPERFTLLNTQFEANFIKFIELNNTLKNMEMVHVTTEILTEMLIAVFRKLKNMTKLRYKRISSDEIVKLETDETMKQLMVLNIPSMTLMNLHAYK